MKTKFWQGPSRVWKWGVGCLTIAILLGLSLRSYYSGNWLLAIVCLLIAISAAVPLVFSKGGDRVPVRNDRTDLVDTGSSTLNRVDARLTRALPEIAGSIALLLVSVGVVVSIGSKDFAAFFDYATGAAAFGMVSLIAKTKQERWWS